MGKLIQANPRYMRQSSLLPVLGGLMFMMLPCLPTVAQTQSSMQEFERANRVAEALRQVTVQAKMRNPGYYSDWQVKGDRIPIWSQQCLGRQLTPDEFEADRAVASTIVTCIVQDMMRQEIRSARNDERLAIRRVAAWWVTGDPGQYDTNVVSAYTQRVLSAYQPNAPITIARPTPPKPISINLTEFETTTATLPQPARPTPVAAPVQTPPASQLTTTAAVPARPDAVAQPANQAAQLTPVATAVKPIPAKPTKPAAATTTPVKPAATPAPSSNAPQLIRPSGTSFYDRYMQEGYAASRKRDYARALLFFRRAVDERPKDVPATTAITNMEAALAAAAAKP